ncbi:hypothetical protein ACYULU_00240 [Breznakiellaceae bacterium SP9]
MKRNIASIFAAALLCAACSFDGGLLTEGSLKYDGYRLEFPQLPQLWLETLGAPHWRLVWVNPQNELETAITTGANPPDIHVLAHTASPVLAFPFWPVQGIEPGLMRPYGAVFPFDRAGSTIVLSRQGGIAAHFYTELTRISPPQDYPLRRAEYFNWPRFNELFSGGVLQEAMQADPWLADWQSIAQKSVESGFDRRRLKAQTSVEMLIPIYEGRWFGSSPYAGSLSPEGAIGLRVDVTDAVDAYFSTFGILKVKRGTWMLIPYKD